MGDPLPIGVQSGPPGHLLGAAGEFGVTENGGVLLPQPVIPGGPPGVAGEGDRAHHPVTQRLGVAV